MRILVTGVGGFIGTYLAEKWQNDSHQLICIGRTPRTAISEMPVVFADLADGVPINESVDAIVHVAAQSPASGVTTEQYIRSNVDAVRKLIQYARSANVARFIYLSSVSIYGRVSQAVIDENTPIYNPDMYGMTKYIGEMLLKDAESWLSSVALRLPGVLGRGAHTPWLAKVAEQLKNNQPVRIYNPEGLFNNMVHVADLESFIVKLLTTRWRGYEAVTLGCCEARSVFEIIESFHKYFNSKSEIYIESGQQASFSISIAKACAMGYNPMAATQILELFSREYRAKEGGKN